MVCDRCIKVVADELAAMDDIEVKRIDLGIIELANGIDKSRMTELHNRLARHGFEIIEDHRSRLIKEIKLLVINAIQHEDGAKKESEPFSTFIGRKMGYDYAYLNEIFSQVEGKTIGQYVIDQKVEKIKELLIYDELTLSEIAWRLNYSSVQYLSAQFKKYTGLTPTHFKEIGQSRRKSIDKI